MFREQRENRPSANQTRGRKGNHFGNAILALWPHQLKEMLEKRQEVSESTRRPREASRATCSSIDRKGLPIRTPKRNKRRPPNGDRSFGGRDSRRSFAPIPLSSIYCNPHPVTRNITSMERLNMFSIFALKASTPIQ